MKNLSRDSLYQVLDELKRLSATPPLGVRSQSASSSSSGLDFEIKLGKILRPLFEKEGFTFLEESRSKRFDSGADALAYKVMNDPIPNYQIACQFKFSPTNRPLRLDRIAPILVSSSMSDYDKLLFVSNSRLTHKAEDAARRFGGVKVEIIDLEDIRSWIDRVFGQDQSLKHEAEIIIRSFSQALAKAVAKDPQALEYVEWRDLERLLAEVFEGLGFGVELTPSSKDGGKDIILQCRLLGIHRSYIVEVKHWRSGKKVSSSAVRSFLTVIEEEGRDGGLYLSTYGYSSDAFQMLTEVERQRLRFGAKEKIVSLCRNYMKQTLPSGSQTEIYLRYCMRLRYET
jgi:restriction system protein